MAYFFGDGFDLYTAITDCGTYWDAAFGANATLALSASGRFAGSRGLTQGVVNIATAPYITKTSGANDAVHHLSLAIQQTLLTGTASILWFTFYDGTNAQCSLIFRSDGAILLNSGLYTGTTLATYTGAVAGTNTWYQFEIEIVINNATGSIAVRRNGNTSNDFSLGSLNTRPGSTNNYANKIGVNCASSTSVPTIDDFLWRSDASSVAWAGDVRCYTRMPAADSSVAWSRTGVPLIQQTQGQSTTTLVNNASMRLTPYTVSYYGNITSVTIVTSASVTGNMKCAIYADSAGQPAAVLASAGPIASVAAGNNVFTLSSPLAVVVGQKIWIAAINDTTAGSWAAGAAGSGASAAATYATFPQASPVASGSNAVTSSITFGLAAGNYAQVAEPQQDGAATYNYSSTVSQSDLYTLQPIGSTPAGVLAVTTRGYMQKSDAGTRLAAVQLQSGASAPVQATPLALPAGSWAWNWRTDLVDPNTGSAWTAVGVSNALVGVICTT